MADADPPGLATAQSFPHGVPILIDAEAPVTLRAPGPGDLPGMVEQCRDPEMIRWTSVPTPKDGYQLRDAEEFLALTAAGWTSGERLGWTIQAQRGSERAFCGSIDLHLEGDGVADVGFGLHPEARGRSIMTAALQLVCNYGFEVAGLQVIRWRAVVGNWASRRVAAKVGFSASDVDRIVEACSDPRTAHWLVAMPRPYQRHNALAYLESLRELAARGIGVTWCLADPGDDRCLGSISLDGLNSYARRGEIGYWAHPDARGRGVVTEAVRLVTRHAKEAGLATSLTIRCARGNTASRRVAERAGYTKVGIQPASEPLSDGELADLVLYSYP